MASGAITVGDAVYRMVMDLAGVDKGIAATEGKARSAGVRISDALSPKNLAKGLATTLALAAGFATKGLLQLQKVQADFQAETGATADEADRAGKAINDMSGKNIQPLAEIGAALTKVHTDLGLAGDEAVRTTQDFLTFGRATKQDAAAAVKDFDDILDAWSLTAAAIPGLMDKLIVSHQRYGGSIVDNQKALSALAPSMRAANLTIDDGIALLNLFEASGIDSAVAVTGMTKALTKVKSPEELKRLVADIIATEDPFKRAQMASDLFGAKAGAKLANALKPGSGGLEAFAIATDDAAGATQAAADVLDSTWGARFQLMLKSAGAAVTGFGASFGPAVTGMVSLVSLAGSLGGPKLIGALGAVLGSVWTAVAASPIVVQAVTFAAGKATTIYLAGLIAGDALAVALNKAWAATGARALAAAGISGTAAGTAFAVAASAAIVAAPLVVLAVAVKIQSDLDDQAEALRKKAAEFAKIATDADLANSIKGVREQLDGMVFDTFHSKSAVIDTLNELVAEQNRRTTEMGEHFQGVGAAATGMATDAEAAASRVIASAGAVGATVGVMENEIVVATARFRAEAINALMDLPAKLKELGHLAVTAYAQGILDKQSVVGAAFAALINQEKTEMGKAKEIAYLVGVLTSKALSDGLNDTRPGVRAAAEETRRLAEERLAELRPRARNIGKQTNAELAAGLKSKDPDVRAQAQRTAKIVDAELKKTAAARAAGLAAAKAYAAGLASSAAHAAVVGAVAGLAGIVNRGLSGTHPGGGGQQQFATGTPYVQRDMIAGIHRGEIIVPKAQADDIRAGRSSLGAGGSTTNNITAVLNGLPRATDPFAVANQLRRLAKYGLLTPAEPG